jgi:excisionase family DNA binding protein
MRRSNNIVELKGKKGGKSTQGITNPRLLPLKRAAEYLGLSLWSLRERIWAGDIPVVRFNGGRKMFIDTQDLEDFIARNKERIV